MSFTQHNALKLALPYQILSFHYLDTVPPRHYLEPVTQCHLLKKMPLNGTSLTLCHHLTLCQCPYIPTSSNSAPTWVPWNRTATSLAWPNASLTHFLFLPISCYKISCDFNNFLHKKSYASTKRVKNFNFLCVCVCVFSKLVLEWNIWPNLLLVTNRSKRMVRNSILLFYSIYIELFGMYILYLHFI